MNKKIILSAFAAIFALNFSTSCSYFPMKKDANASVKQDSSEECAEKKCKGKKGKCHKKAKAEAKVEAKTETKEVKK